MNLTILAILLVILMLLIDNNFFNLNVEKFAYKNKIDQFNKKTIWVYNPIKLSHSGLIKLCLKTIQKHFNGFNIIVFTEKQIKKIIPEYMTYLNSCKSDYIFLNMLKYFILYKHGGIWIPRSTIIINKFNIDEEPYNNNKLIFFGEKSTQHNSYFNRFNFNIIASQKGTEQIKKIIDILIENINEFNNGFIFNKKLDYYLNKDAHIHLSPILISSNLVGIKELLSTFINIKLKDHHKLIFLEIDDIKKTSKYRYMLDMSETEIMKSELFISKLFKYSGL